MTTFPTKRGEFNLLRKIGEGGMAEVFLAERGGDEGFKTLVALKRLHGGFALDQYFIRQLVQEAKLLGQLQHNNIVRVHDLRRIEDEYFIVMEYIDGIDLAQAIQVHRDNDLRFPLSIFFHIALSLCEALEFAHSAVDLTGKPIRLIHRDIKPSNVLIHHRGIVKLTDFGIARVGDTSNTGSVVKGTANYMSPEQASGEQNLTPASDIFSLGAVFWEMLTLEKLVEGNNYLNVINSIKELNVGLKDITKKGIEPGLRMILLRMLARKRELRYQNMGLVLKDLRFVAEQMKVDLSPSHLREYMAKITNLAREAAARMYSGQNLAAQDPDAPTPRPSEPVVPSAGTGAPPGLKSRSAEVSSDPAPAPSPPPAKPPPPIPKRGDAAFAESVAALKKLVQAGPGKGPAVATPAAAAAAAAPPAPARPDPCPAPPAQLGRDTGGMKKQPPAGARPAPPKAPPPRSAPPSGPGPAAALTPSASYVGPGPRQRPPTDASYAPADAPTAPPRKPEPIRPGQVPPRRQIDDAAASAPSAAALKSVGEIAEAAGLAGPVVRAAQAPGPPANPNQPGLVRRNTNDPRVKAATAEVAALIAKRTAQYPASQPKSGGPRPPVPVPPPAAAPPPASAPPPRSAPPPSARPAAPPPAARPAPPPAAPRPAVPPPPAPVPATRPQPSVSAMPPQPSMSAAPPADTGTWDGYDDDYDEDDEAYYAQTRRANMIVLGVGLIAAILVFGLIGVLWLLPGETPEEPEPVAVNTAPAPVETPAPTRAPEPEPELADSGFDDPELDSGRTSRGSRGDSTPPPRHETDRWSDRGTTSGSSSRSTPSQRDSVSISTLPSSGSRSSSSDSTPRSSGSTSRSASSPSSSGSHSRSSGSSDSSGDWRSSGSSDSGSSSSGSTPRSSGSGSRSDLRDPYDTPTRDDSEDDWAIAGEGSTAASDPGGDPSMDSTVLGSDVMAGMTDKARRGRLSDDEIRRLESIDRGSDEYESSRAVLMAQYEASGDRGAHCETVGEVLRLDRNQANPQFNLEMGKCHLRQGRYKDALQAARVAELNAQDIPARIRTDRQLKIWEIQAKSYKGLYQGSENLDYIDDSIAVWKRYQHLAENTYRQREAERAEGEIRELGELKDGAL